MRAGAGLAQAAPLNCAPTRPYAGGDRGWMAGPCCRTCGMATRTNSRQNSRGYALADAVLKCPS
eukprot:3265430-Lingulodinium_polyedra.AAC.1